MDRGIDVDVDMDIDSEVAVSVNWRLLQNCLGLL